MTTPKRFPLLAIHKRKWSPYIFKCNFPGCCNFFSSVGNRSIKYCGIHLYLPGFGDRTVTILEVYSR